MIVSLVVAMDEQNLIGKDGGLPWRLPADLAHFKKSTLGKPIVMGRKTWESLGRPLPGRENLVLTRQHDYQAEGASVYHTVAEVLSHCADVEEVCVIGGAEIYALFLDHCDQIILTRVHARCDGDTYFPWRNQDAFVETERRERAADDRNPYSMSFITLELRR